jgi:hypothetical protein
MALDNPMAFTVPFLIVPFNHDSGIIEGCGSHKSGNISGCDIDGPDGCNVGIVVLAGVVGGIFTAGAAIIAAKAT